MTGDDLALVAGRLVDQKVTDWLTASGVSLDAMCDVFAAANRQFDLQMEAGSDVHDTLTDLIGNAFRLGWECHRQLRVSP